MALDIDTARAFRTPAELRGLIEAVRDSGADEMELDWIEWKCSDDPEGPALGDRIALGDKRWKVEIARQAMGFANREPAAAAPTAEGCAYLLLGVAPGRVEGVETIDIAELEGPVVKYTGADGPRWRPDYVQVGERTVLVVSVEAPREGDRIFAFERASGKWQRGYIPVRKPGKTVPADADDLRLLTRRASATERRLGIDVTWDPDPGPVGAVRMPEPDEVDRWMDRVMQNYLKPLQHVAQQHAAASRPWLQPSKPSPANDRRSPEEYRVDVSRYVSELRARSADAIATFYVRSRQGPTFRPVVRNRTEHNFENILLVLDIAGDVRAFFDERHVTLGNPLPNPPLPWGEDTALAAALGGSRLPTGLPSVPYTGAIRNTGSTQIRFDEFNLRPDISNGRAPFTSS